MYGDNAAEAYIKVWLINLNSCLNLKRKLEEHHIDECAFLIILEYKNIMIADINLIFKNAKMGKYGELYESLSIDKVLKWFSDYMNERCEVYASVSIQESEKFKYEEQKHNRSSSSEILKMKSAMDHYNLELLKKKSDENNQ